MSPFLSERKANIFDWDQEEESKMIETYSSNAFGLNTSDLEDAHEFLKHSKLDAKDGQDTNEIVGEAWGGDKFSLKGEAFDKFEIPHLYRTLNLSLSIAFCISRILSVWFEHHCI